MLHKVCSHHGYCLISRVYDKNACLFSRRRDSRNWSSNRLMEQAGWRKAIQRKVSPFLGWTKSHHKLDRSILPLRFECACSHHFKTLVAFENGYIPDQFLSAQFLVLFSRVLVLGLSVFTFLPPGGVFSTSGRKTFFLRVQGFPPPGVKKSSPGSTKKWDGGSM